MRNFRVVQGEVSFTVEAERIEEAAKFAVSRLYPMDRIYARRATGEPGMSGFFTGYVPVPPKHGGGLTSHGKFFHVSEIVL